MSSARKPRWQQVTALVSVSAGGAITGLHFAPGAAPQFTSPSGTQLTLVALERTTQAAKQAPANDAALRSAIVNVARYYLRMAASKTPAEMEAIIWQHDSIDGVDHGESCAAFASLTLELASHAVGQRSWVTGGTSYPWPLHKWADVRVEPNRQSPAIISILQDARAHGRWHPLGDGYQPLPGDWVLFEGHVEVVTEYSHGVLHTIGGDSLPNFSVNAHEYHDPLASQSVIGFVDNGQAGPESKAVQGAGQSAAHPPRAPVQARPRARIHPRTGSATESGPGIPARAPGPTGGASASGLGTPDGGGVPSPGPGVPGAFAPAAVPAPGAPPGRAAAGPGAADVPGLAAPSASPGPSATIPGTVAPGAAQGISPAPAPAAGQSHRPAASPPPHGPAPARAGQDSPPRGCAAPDPVIPGLLAPTGRAQAGTGHQVSRPAPSAAPPAPAPSAPLDAAAEQAFISEVAPWAMATQHTYGVPAAVTIAQAIDESGWGRSELATRDHNLFGMKGTGPAGSAELPTQEFEHGRLVTRVSAFRVYHDIAESVEDHARLLATSGYYQQAMADREDPNAFAAALTGVYATDPGYGAKLIRIMRRYDLYRYDLARRRGAAAPSPAMDGPTPGPPGRAAGHSAPGTSGTGPAAAASASPAPGQAAVPGTARIRPGAPASGSAGRTSARSQTVRPPSAAAAASPVTLTGGAARAAATPRPAAAPSRRGRAAGRYQRQIPASVRDVFFATARGPLLRAEPLYRDVASHRGIGWELLAACDWMQCEARPRRSPVHGEKLGTANPDGTVYCTKSQALEQCADDLADLAWAVYRIDLTGPSPLSVRDLANAFAAFRWGALLRRHHISAMEFPYSVEGLTGQHIGMRWPDIAEAPDKPGARFRMHFGAVPVVLQLNYPATV